MVASRRGVHRFEGLTQRRGASTCYLQQLPEHVFAQNICRNLNAWGFASCGTCCTWLKEAVLDDDDAWARRLRASDTLLQRYSPSAIAVEFVDCRVRSSQLWAQVYDDGGALCAGDTQREASSRVEASRFARVVALTASLHDVEAAGDEGDLGVLYGVACGLASLAAPWELAALIDDDARPLARAAALFGAFLRCVDRTLSPIEAMAPLGDEALVAAASCTCKTYCKLGCGRRPDESPCSPRRPLRAAATGCTYRAKVWGLGGLQLYRLRDSVHSARETSSLLARGVLYHIGDAARRAAVDASLDASQRAVAFLCFVKANVGRPRPSGIKRPVLIVSDPE